MSPGFVIFLVSAAISLGAVSTVEAENPGLNVQLSKKTFDYASHLALLKARAMVLKTHIPDQGGRKGSLKYSITGLRITRLDVKSTSVVFIPNKGLHYKLNGFGIKISGRIRVRYHFIRKTNNFDIDASQISVGLSVALGFNAATGKLTAKAGSCGATVPTPRVRFHGGGAWLINRLSGYLGRKIRDAIKSKICSSSTINAINKGLEESLSKLPTRKHFLTNFVLDVKMVKAPLINQIVMKTQHKGEVFWVNNYKESPLPVRPMEPIPSVTANSMATVQMSTYLLQTFSYVAHQNNFIRYIIDSKNVPKAGVLNTTCTTAMCIGHLIPGIGKKYPNRQVSIMISSTSRPVPDIKSGYLHLDAPLSVTIYLSTDNPNKPLLILPVRIHTVASASVDKQIARFKVSTLNVTLGMERKHMPIEINVKELEMALNFFIRVFALPKINKKGSAGIPLPQPSKVIKLYNTHFKLGLNSALLMTDLVYTGSAFGTDSHPLNAMGFPHYGIVNSLASINASALSGECD